MATVTESNAVLEYDRATKLWERKFSNSQSLEEMRFWSTRHHEWAERIATEHDMTIEHLASLWLDWQDKLEALEKKDN